jgi:hypothetical protein
MPAQLMDWQLLCLQAAIGRDQAQHRGLCAQQLHNSTHTLQLKVGNVNQHVRSCMLLPLV